MSLIEEELPGVQNVRKNFQLKEDSLLAKRLQDREYEEHFNANVQLRRTAMEDTKVAKKYQMDELGQFKQMEKIRQQQLRTQEELDSLEAERLAKLLEEEDEKRRRHDEEMALKLNREETELEAAKRNQEEVDMRLARQHFEREQRLKEEERLKRLKEDEEAAKKLQHLEISKSRGKTNGDQVKPILDLPTYDSLGFIGSIVPPVSDSTHDDYVDDDEPPVDEMARMEAEDARLARELMEREQKEIERRKAEQERADIELARRLMEAENKTGNKSHTPADSDFEVASRMNASEQDRLRQQRDIERKDMELARRMTGELQRHRSEQEIDDWELAKRLQKQELKIAKAKKPEPPPNTVYTPTSSLPADITNGQYQPYPSRSVPPMMTAKSSPQMRVPSVDDDFDNGVGPTAKMAKKRQQPVKQSTKKGIFKK